MPEQEPNGWELLRAIKGIENRIDTFASTFVPLAVHNLLAERVKDLESEVDSEKNARHDGDAALRKEMDDQRKTKAQQWFSIGLLLVGGIVTLAFSIFRQGAGLP